VHILNFLSKDLYSDIYDLGVLYNFENPTESLPMVQVSLKKKTNIFDHFANISSLKQLFGYRFLELNNVSKFRGSSWSYGSFTTTCEISVYHHLSCASNLVHGKVYSIQLYVIKFVSDLQQVSGFLWELQFPPPIKLTTTI
jgi:hypothetical protein